MDCDLWQSQVTPAAQVEVTHTAPPRVTQSSQASYALPSTESFTRAVISGGKEASGSFPLLHRSSSRGPESDSRGHSSRSWEEQASEPTRTLWGEHTDARPHPRPSRGISGQRRAWEQRTSLKVLGQLGSTEG